MDDIARRMLSTPPKPKQQKGKHKFQIDWNSFDVALAGFHELVELSLRDIYLANIVSSYGDAGAPFITAHVDEFATTTTGHKLVRYQLADDLLIHLAAVRTRNI